MSRFTIKPLPLDGLKLITSTKIEDSRGFFSRIFCINDLPVFDFTIPINQINHSYTKNKGTIRGLHYQLNPFSETKLINCLKGRVFDVAVDLRPNSKTYLKYFGIELSEETNDALLIPEGFAHGFQTLTSNVEMLYFHSMPYNKEFESGLNPFDKVIQVDWPKEVSEISQRDKELPSVDKDFKGVSP